jgi:hypothetical protein
LISARNPLCGNTFSPRTRRYAHPSGDGHVAEVIANNTASRVTRRWYRWSFGFMSFIVWAHHMFMTGMGTTMSAFFRRRR